MRILFVLLLLGAAVAGAWLALGQPTPERAARTDAEAPATGAPPTPAEAVARLASHAAAYTVTLERAAPATGIAAVEGVMATDFENICDGVVLNQRLATRLITADGAEIVSDLTVSTYESADFTSFEFSTVHRFNGRIETNFSGTAEPVNGEAVAVDYREGGEARLPDVLFPTEFSAQLLTAALRGERRIARSVFDGAEGGDYYRAAATIGDEVLDLDAAERAERMEAGGAALDGLRSWPVTISYYEAGKRTELPDYEISFLMFENGVVDDLVMDYGEYAMQASLRRLTLEENVCN